MLIEKIPLNKSFTQPIKGQSNILNACNVRKMDLDIVREKNTSFMVIKVSQRTTTVK